MICALDLTFASEIRTVRSPRRSGIGALTGPISVGLHLGVHKTATTHLRFSLRDSREALVAKGVRYYGPDYLRLRGRSIPQVFGLGDRRQQRRSVGDQISFMAKDGNRILLSEENFAGQLIDGRGVITQPLYGTVAGQVQELADKLVAEGAALDLFVALRSPATFVTSCYSQALLGGHFSTPTEFATHNPPAMIDWVGFVRSLAGISNLRQMFVWRYEDYAAVLPKVLSRMLGADAAKEVALATAIANQGLSARALDSVLEAQANGNTWLSPARARKRLPVGPDSPPFGLFGPEELRRDRDRYASQIAQIAQISELTVIRP